MIRESVFVCTCRSGEVVRTAHVRAWDESEAAELFVRELKDEGVGDTVDVRVRASGPRRARGATDAH